MVVRSSAPTSTLELYAPHSRPPHCGATRLVATVAIVVAVSLLSRCRPTAPSGNGAAGLLGLSPQDQCSDRRLPVHNRRYLAGPVAPDHRYAAFDQYRHD